MELHIRRRVKALADLELLCTLDEAVDPVLRLADRDDCTRVPVVSSCRFVQSGQGNNVRVESAMHRCPAAPKAAPTIELSAKFWFASGSKMQWSVTEWR